MSGARRDVLVCLASAVVGAGVAWRAVAHHPAPDVAGAAEAVSAPAHRPSLPGSSVEVPEQDELCGDFEARCELRMHSAGCKPMEFPPEAEGRFDPPAVEQWVEEHSRSCPAFAQDLLAVDCSQYPCQLLVRQQERQMIDDRGAFTIPKDRLTCGEGDLPGFLWVTGSASPEAGVDFMTILPEALVGADVYYRAARRIEGWSEADLEALRDGR